MRVQLRIYTTPELDISFNLHTPKDLARAKVIDQNPALCPAYPAGLTLIST